MVQSHDDRFPVGTRMPACARHVSRSAKYTDITRSYITSTKLMVTIVTDKNHLRLKHNLVDI